MKRAKEEYITAVNGLEALHKYQADHQSIKVIFMGKSPFSYINVLSKLLHLKISNVPIKQGTMSAL